MKDYWIITYSTYLVLAIPTMIWVARTLEKNGLIFLIDVFQGNRELAQSINKLLVVGFYLINMGFIALYMKVNSALLSQRIAIEVTFTKLGFVILVLGIMHFFNIILFTKLRRQKNN